MIETKTFRTLVSLATLAVAGCAVGAGDSAGDEPSVVSDKTDDAEPVATAAGADFSVTSMSLTIGTGSDDLRSSSTVYLSALRSDGTWSTEYPIMGSGASSWSSTNAYISSWNGLDPCVTRLRLRLQQGSCFGCTSDNWDVSSLNVTMSYLGGPRTLLAMSPVTRLTESSPTVELTTLPVPARTYCGSGSHVADCSGAIVDLATAMAWKNDAYCDDGQWGMNLVCSAFEHDNGLCGRPSAWTCSPTYYRGGAADGCDCNCGAWDPDCNDPNVNSKNRTVYGCSSGLVCINRQTSPGVYAPSCAAPFGGVK